MQPENPVIPGHDQITFASDQPEYFPLPAIRLENREGEVITRWKPDADDLAALNNGESIYLHQWMFGRPLTPVMLHVATPEQVEDEIKTGTSIRYIELAREEVTFASEVPQ